MSDFQARYYAQWLLVQKVAMTYHRPTDIHDYDHIKVIALIQDICASGPGQVQDFGDLLDIFCSSVLDCTRCAVRDWHRCVATEIANVKAFSTFL